jgi:hypothetical protein
MGHGLQTRRPVRQGCEMDRCAMVLRPFTMDTAKPQASNGYSIHFVNSVGKDSNTVPIEIETGPGISKSLESSLTKMIGS